MHANEEKLGNSELFQMISENFSTRPAKPLVDASKIDDSTATLKRKGQMKELRLIDDKQAQNLSILLRSLKAEPNEISRWLVECNTDKLTVVVLEQLEKFLPEDKTLVKYQELKENIDELDNSEKFLVVVSFRGFFKRV